MRPNKYLERSGPAAAAITPKRAQPSARTSRTATATPGAFGDSAQTLGDLRYVVNSRDMALRASKLSSKPSRPAVPAPKARRQRDSYTPVDAIFSGGNFSKVSPITRIHCRALRPGPFYRKARELYWVFA